MTEEIRSFLAGTVALDVMLVVAVVLTWNRRPAGRDPAARRQLMRLAAAALAVQGVHFVEEWLTHFYLWYPELLGLAPWSASLWVAFNLAWIAVWALALGGLVLDWRLAQVPIWFLAIASAVNGVAHPLLALAAGGYFPGLWSSPLCLVAGVVLLREMTSFTRPVAA